MGKDVIVACDFPDAAKTCGFLELFGDRRPFIKIGMELFCAEGPGFVRRLKARGHRIFLDLKLHDIPNTVRAGMRVLAGLGADMADVHAGGTVRMMAAAREGLDEACRGINPSSAACRGSDPAGAGRRGARCREARPLLIAVTMLTSTDQESMERELLIDRPLRSVVEHYALNARAAGLDGVVCSPLEAGRVHDICGRDFLTVTPGVRFEDSEAADQRRVATPARAREMGSDYIVVGRPITEAADPAAAYERCLRDFIG